MADMKQKVIAVKPVTDLSRTTCEKSASETSTAKDNLSKDPSVKKSSTALEIAQAWTTFKPKVPFSYFVAARKAARNR